MPPPLLYVTKQGGIGIIQPLTAAHSRRVPPPLPLFRICRSIDMDVLSRPNRLYLYEGKD